MQTKLLEWPTKLPAKSNKGSAKRVGSEKLQGEGAGQEARGDAKQLKGDAKNAVKAGVNKVADTEHKKL